MYLLEALFLNESSDYRQIHLCIDNAFIFKSDYWKTSQIQFRNPYFLYTFQKNHFIK